MATGVHALYNTLLERGYILSIIVLCLGGYVAFTQWLTSEER